jgi:ribosomal protein S12 methylthiotransferase
MKLQQGIVFERTRELVGKVFDVLIEGRIAEEDNVYLGRTYMDAPQVDGFIFLTYEEMASQGELISGDIVKATVTGAKGYDLVGEIIEGSKR